MDVLSTIETTFADAVRNGCEENKCKLGTTGLERCLILSGKSLVPDRKACDCIVFVVSERQTVALVELKSKSVHGVDVRAQLEGGTKAAIRVLQKCGARPREWRFVHAVLSRGHRGAEVREWARRDHRITVEGKPCRVLWKSCGTELTQLI